MLIDIIAGARPNFMKIAPIIKEIDKLKSTGIEISYRLIHTGQHYDEKMSGSFFKELQIPAPHINLNVGSGSHSFQTANIMIGYEKVLQENKCDLTLVVGDVNSTMACSIVSKKMNIKVAHVEAGIRSFDRKMPEEINRLITDSISDYFFTTSTSANEQLRKEGIPREKIFFVGNTMIDTLLSNLPYFKRPKFWDKNELREKEYLVLTLHRPSNVDDAIKLKNILDQLCFKLKKFKIIFPVHPRTKIQLDRLDIIYNNLIFVEPLGYHEFNYLTQNSRGIITDSGGITEEATVLGVPCITLRRNTERPETVSIGSNELAGNDTKKLELLLDRIISNNWKKFNVPELWDGNAGKRIVEHLLANRKCN